MGNFRLSFHTTTVFGIFGAYTSWGELVPLVSSVAERIALLVGWERSLTPHIVHD